MTDKITISKATKADIRRFYGIDMPTAWEGIVGKRGKLIVGVGGVFVTPDGEVQGFMDLSPYARKPLVFRYVIMYLRELKARGIDCIKVMCDTRFNRAEEFLLRLGFEKTDEETNGMRCWKWQH